MSKKAVTKTTKTRLRKAPNAIFSKQAQPAQGEFIVRKETTSTGSIITYVTRKKTALAGASS